MNIRYISRNTDKIKEVKSILGSAGVAVSSVTISIVELQTGNAKDLVKDKALKAFKQVGRKLFVDHTSLELECLNGFPGGLTQVFWDTLKADRFAELYGNNANPKVTAKTFIGYIDCKKFHMFEGKIEGRIAEKPAGDRGFQWDCVFIPDGWDQTFAVMGQQKKNEISMRKLALDSFAKFLKEAGQSG